VTAPDPTAVLRSLQYEIAEDLTIKCLICAQPNEEHVDGCPVPELPDAIDAVVKFRDAARETLTQYAAEETEHGFPFNFALRDAHRALQAALALFPTDTEETT